MRTRLGRVAVLGILVVMAGVARFAELGEAPLDAGEAARSAAAWWTATGAGEGIPRLAPAPDSALLLGLDTALFWTVATSSDGLARVVPAAVGTALVLLPLLLRSTQPSAVIPLALLLALDPWLLTASRRASGAILAASAALVCHLLLRRLAVAASARPLAAAARRQWLWWSVAAGLLLVSGTAAWDFLPLVVSSAVIAARSGSWTEGSLPRAATLLGVGAAAALLGATTGLAQWRGPALVSTSLQEWLGSWTGSLRAVSFEAGSGRALIVYLVAMVALALAGAWGGPRSGEPETTGAGPAPATALLLWGGWGLAMQLRRGESPDTWLALELPLLLAAALGLERCWRGWLRATVARRGTVVAATAALVAVALAARVGVARQPPALPAARLLASDLEVLLARPAAERPRLEIASGPSRDAVLAWYLRELPTRWVASPSSAEEESRLTLVSRSQPADAPPPPEPRAPTYAVERDGVGLRVVELR